MQPSRHKLLALVSATLLFVVWGCAHTPGHSGWKWPWSPETDDAVGITTPARRIELMKQMQVDAPKQTQEQQQRIADDLAKQIQGEQDPLVRRHIIRTLGYFNVPVAAVVLKAAINDSDSAARIAACESWGRRGGTEAVEVLTGVLSSDTDTDVRLAAARAIGQTHEKAALGNLAEALVDPNPAIQYRVATSLKEVSGKDFGTDVERWRAYAKGESTQDPPESLVQRVKGWWR
jgi:HEAT repeat protein